jgi:hypothetical protein
LLFFAPFRFPVSPSASRFATNIQAGAKYGYGLLWVVLLANLIAMLFQALSAKLGIATGSIVRRRSTYRAQTSRSAALLSSRKSAMVLWSGASRPSSHINSMFHPASRSSRRLDWTRLR